MFDRKQWHKDYREKHREHLNEYNRQWKEEHSNYHSEWYLKNKARLDKEHKQWKLDNKEYYSKQQAEYSKQPRVRKRFNELNQGYREKDPERYTAYGRKFYSNNKESECLRKKIWTNKNKFRAKVYHNNYRARKMNAVGSHSVAEWVELLKQTKGKCPACNKCVGKNKLTQDHIIPLSKGGSDLISNIQPLCQPCNSSKHDSLDWQGSIWGK